MFYSKTTNRICSPTVSFSLIEHNRGHARVLLFEGIIILDFKPKSTLNYRFLNRNPLEFLPRQLNYSPSFSMSDSQLGFNTSLIIRSYKAGFH